MITQKNIILKTINEVENFQIIIKKCITRKDNQNTFLILSNDVILDVDRFKKYLIKKDLNKFAQTQITNLINEIDIFLELEDNYLNLPISDNHYSYRYPNKGAGFGDGDVLFLLSVLDTFLKADNKTFDDKEPLFKHFNNYNYKSLAIRLKTIKDLIKDIETPPAPEPQQSEPEANEGEKNPLPLIFVNAKHYNNFIEYTKKHIIDFYIDYSYLKKRMESEKFIHKITDKDFFKFLKDNHFVNDKNKTTFENDSKFRSLNKSTSSNRENNFNTIFEI